MSQIDRTTAEAARAWPFEEARKLVARIGGKMPEKGYVLLETGYGPSGLPHIGTFGEVVRTTMVRQAFQRLSDVPARLFCFSDDMDGFRKVPDNVPNREMLAQHLGKPLTAVPDPFGTHASFGEHNNARLKAFLDSFGFEYEFQSATDWYKAGRFDAVLLSMLRHYDEVQAVMLPTLGEERQATYSVFLPVSPKTGRVLQVPVVRIDEKAGTIVYRDEDGALVETPVTGGNVKLQWKADWAGRWLALGVDYEMYGKDLIPSADLSAKIVKVLGGTPPDGFNYELFLDEEGKKISKSKGNGLSVEDWLRYAPPESLAHFMYQAPRRAKRLYFDVIPRAIDDYLGAVEKLPAEEPAKVLDNAAWHIHNGTVPANSAAGVNFGMLLNLAGVANTEDKDVLWQYLRRYVPGATPETAPYLDRLLAGAVAYYQEFVKASKKFRLPTASERPALQDLIETLRELPRDSSPEQTQEAVYEVGKRYLSQSELKTWFQTLYEVLLGQQRGPRWGAFIELSGRETIIRRIDAALRGVVGGAKRQSDALIFEDLVVRIAESETRIPPPTAQDVGLADFKEGPRIFIGPDFSLRKDLSGDKASHQVVLVVAAAATGKSILARKLSSRLGAPVWDLAVSDPVGGNDPLIAILSEAFRKNYEVATPIATAIQAGQRSIVVDALDEGRIKVSDEAFGAFIQSMGEVPQTLATRAPVVLMGRRQAIESAWVYLDDAGISPLVVEIDRFNLDQARYFIEKVVLAGKGVGSGQASLHRTVFRDALEGILGALQRSLAETSVSQFVGYAPVLLSIATYLEHSENLQTVAQRWSAGSPSLPDNIVGLLRRIILEMLLREREKFLQQAWPQLDAYAEENKVALPYGLRDRLYSDVEQISRVVCKSMRTKAPINSLLPESLVGRYEELVGRFMGDHPFLADSDTWASAVFRDYSFANVLVNGDAKLENEVLSKLDQNLTAVSGLFADFYFALLSDQADGESKLSHLPWLYESFRAGADGEVRVEMRLDAGLSNLEAFENTHFVSCECEFAIGKVGAVPKEFFLTCDISLGETLKLNSDIEDVFVNAPCTVQLGRGSDRDFVMSGAISIECAELKTAVSKFVLRERFIDRRGSNYKEEDAIFLAAESVDATQITQAPEILGEVEFSVSFPGDENYPWSKFQADAAVKSTNSAIFPEAFRRFRNIVKSLRANGYGGLARRQMKIESSRVLKDELGERVLKAIRTDGLLILSDGLYSWNPEVASKLVKMPYRDIISGRVSSELQQYLEGV